jgi:Fur family transcriptional regulator, peroxide stress response regulator
MIAPKQIDKRLADFLRLCRERGLKATHQRTEILRELACTDTHPHAESVYLSVRKRIPAISLDTVYRTLRMFEENGVIIRVASVQDRARFDANTERHHHFVCATCGFVGDFHSELLNRFTVPPEVTAIGQVDSVHVELRGHCVRCRKQRMLSET